MYFDTRAAVSSPGLRRTEPLRKTVRNGREIFPIAALWMLLLFGVSQNCRAEFQPMLLSAGKFAVNSATGIIQVAAQCLDEAAHTPEAGHEFTNFTDGIKVTRRSTQLRRR
jgi:hypothetical protein